MIQLDIVGDPGLSFSGDCRIMSGKMPEKRYRVQGKVPAKYWLPGDAVRCSLAKSILTGRMVVRITRDGLVELQQANGSALRWLAITSSGPWGAAKGVASASRPLWQ